MNQKLIDKGMWWEEGVELVSGCSPCSPGCDNCWSADMTHRFTHPVGNISHIDDGLLTTCGGKFNGNIQLHPERLARFNTRKPKVFAIWNDWCHEDVSHDFRHEILKAARTFDNNTYILLTKRPLILLSQYRYEEKHKYPVWGLPNAWNGCTVCTQAEADEKIPVFLQVPGKKFLCLEPLLEKINFRWQPYAHQASGETYRQYLVRNGSYNHLESLKGIDAVIVGTETGPHRRPAKLEWIESIIDQCDAAGVPVFVKAIEINGKVSKDMSQWPAKFRRRELPWIS